MSLKKIVTIGYEGAELQNFLNTLEALGVNTLLDIRELPISRRPGFAKTALQKGLNSIGIRYRHEPRLGSPKAIRHQLREDGDYKKFFRNFAKHLEKQTELLTQLTEELSGTVALLCYERDHKTCHRLAVAEALSELTGIAPKHHGVNAHAKGKASTNSCSHLGQSLSTA